MAFGKGVLFYLLTVCCVILCTQGDDKITVGPRDQHKKPGDTASFSCTYEGSTKPTWIRSDKNGKAQSLYNPNNVVDNTFTVTYANPTGGVATLTIVADLKLNGSQYHCYLNNAANPQPASAKASLHVYGASSPPAFIMTPGYNSILVTWDAPWLPPAVSGIVFVNYELQLHSATGTILKTEKIAGGPGSVLIHTFHGISPNTSYKVRMRAENSVGFSEWSDFTVKTTPTSQVPDKPVDIKTSININGGTPMITVTWKAPELTLFEQSPIEKYTLYYKKGDGELKQLTTTSLTASVPTPELGVEYKVSVSATNDGGESAKSKVTKATVQYLIGGELKVVKQKLNVTCKFEITDVTVKCSVRAVEKESMANITKAEEVTTGAKRSEVNFMVDMSPGTYNIAIQAVDKNGAPLEDFKITNKAVKILKPQTNETNSTTVTTEPTTDSGSRVTPTAPSLSQVEMGIAGGIIGGFLFAVVMIPMLIFMGAMCCMSKKRKLPV